VNTVTVFLADPNTLRVSFGYDAALVDAIKTIEGATFDRPSKTWRLPLRKLDKLLAVVGDVAAVAPEVFLAASPVLPVEHFANTCAMGHVVLTVVGDKVQGSGGAWTPVLQAEIDKRASQLRRLLASGWQPYTPDPVLAPPEPRPVEELTHVTAVDVLIATHEGNWRKREDQKEGARADAKRRRFQRTLGQMGLYGEDA
jgi:hypothetical protein